MAISVTNIGSAGATSGSNATITVGAGGVPGASLLCAGTSNRVNNAGYGTIADTPGNAYTQVTGDALAASQANGRGQLTYKENCTALTSGNTITYTPPANGANCISAFYATGVATTGSLDTAVTAKATGTSTSPTVTSGTPTVAGELFVGLLCGFGNSGTFTQATPTWATPFNEGTSGTASGNARVNGANQVNSAKSTLTYNPGTSVSTQYVDIIAGFKPAVVAQFTNWQQPVMGFVRMVGY